MREVKVAQHCTQFVKAGTLTLNGLLFNRITVWNAIKPADYIDDDADKEYIIRTISTLRLEFRQILKIDNLQGDY